MSVGASTLKVSRYTLKASSEPPILVMMCWYKPVGSPGAKREVMMTGVLDHKEHRLR